MKRASRSVETLRSGRRYERYMEREMLWVVAMSRNYNIFSDAERQERGIR